MARVFRILVGALFGAVLSVALVLLFTPRSGDEIRESIQDWIQSILAEGQEAAEVRRLELSERFESLKKPNPQS